MQQESRNCAPQQRLYILPSGEESSFDVVVAEGRGVKIYCIGEHSYRHDRTSGTFYLTKDFQE